MSIPVLLLHSSLASGGQWRSLVSGLGGRYHVVAPDLIGYGAMRAWSGARPFELRHEARHVHALLDLLREPAHLVGHSYGGAVALEVARTRRDLRSLTLVEPVAFHLLRDGDAGDAAALAEIEEVAAMVERAVATGDAAVGCGMFVDYWSGKGAWAAMGQTRRMAATERFGKVALDFRATLGHSVRLADVEEIDVPALVIQGERSPAPTRRICGHLAGRLSDVRAEAIAGAGHMCPITHAEDVNPLIAAHLDANSQHRGTASHPHHPRRQSWIPQS